MNSHKLKQLFAATCQEPAPELPDRFAEGVLAAIRREEAPAATLMEQLAALFPRLALAAGLLIAIGVGIDWYFAAAGGLSADAAAVAEQWLFTAVGI